MGFSVLIPFHVTCVADYVEVLTS